MRSGARDGPITSGQGGMVWKNPLSPLQAPGKYCSTIFHQFIELTWTDKNPGNRQHHYRTECVNWHQALPMKWFQTNRKPWNKINLRDFQMLVHLLFAIQKHQIHDTRCFKITPHRFHAEDVFPFVAPFSDISPSFSFQQSLVELTLCEFASLSYIIPDKKKKTPHCIWCCCCLFHWSVREITGNELSAKPENLPPKGQTSRATFDSL